MGKILVTVPLAWWARYIFVLILIGMRQGGFIPLIIFGLDFVS